MNKDRAPCPFCGSTDLLGGSWYIDDDEVAAIECNNCKAGVENRTAASPARFA